MREDVKEKYGIDLPLMPTKKERRELIYVNNCWACGIGKRHSSLIDSAHVYGRSFCYDNNKIDSNNEVNLCRDCHRASPDTSNSESFFYWMSTQKHYMTKTVDDLIGMLKLKYKSEDEVNEHWDKQGLSAELIHEHMEELKRSMFDGFLLINGVGNKPSSRTAFIYTMLLHFLDNESDQWVRSKEDEE